MAAFIMLTTASSRYALCLPYVRKTFGLATVGAGHAREKMFAGTKNFYPGTRMARSYTHTALNASWNYSFRGFAA